MDTLNTVQSCTTVQSTVLNTVLLRLTVLNIFWAKRYKRYKRNQWNLPNILAYISGIFDDFFEAGLVPLKAAVH